MVLAPGKINSDILRSEGRRVSSPISIPNGKLPHLNRLAENAIRENDSSPLSSPGNYPSPTTVSQSLPTPGRLTHLPRMNSDGYQESEGSISELPDCSPAFTAVFSELVKLEDTKIVSKKKSLSVADCDSVNSTPSLPRKELRFALDEEFEKLRPRSLSHHTTGRKKKSSPSSTQSTPALSRRTRKPVNLVPKYKFLTETITVSHEDIVKQEEKERMDNEFTRSPKSIFSVL